MYPQRFTDLNKKTYITKIAIYVFLLYKCTSTYKTMSMVSRYKFSNLDIYAICNINVYCAI